MYPTINDPKNVIDYIYNIMSYGSLTAWVRHRLTYGAGFIMCSECQVMTKNHSGASKKYKRLGIAHRSIGSDSYRRVLLQPHLQ